jgi:general secretion pathway protein D
VQGTPEFVERAQKIAKEVDVRPAQVKIEVSLIEVSNSKAKVFAPSFGTLRAGEFGINVLGGASGGFSNAVNGLRSQSIQNNLASTNFRLPTVGVQFKDQTTSGKLLANPNIIALDGTTSTVNITDSIVYFQTTVTNSGGTVTVTTQPQTQEVGIKLSITPHITNDGSVTLALTPSVTQLLGIKTEPISGTSAPQTSQRDFTLSAVRVRDGETLMIGGLVRDFASKDITKIPGLADLPIVGALFRATSADPGNLYTRSEIVVMVTPHILREEGEAYFGYGVGNQDKEKPAYLPKKPENMQSGMVGHQPLPKFSAGELPTLQKDADVKLGQFSFPKPAKAINTSTNRLDVPSVRTTSNTSTSTPKKQEYNMLNYTQGNNVSEKGSIPRQVTSPYSSVNTNDRSRSTNGYSSYESPRPY